MINYFRQNKKLRYFKLFDGTVTHFKYVSNAKTHVRLKKQKKHSKSKRERALSKLIERPEKAHHVYPYIDLISCELSSMDIVTLLKSIYCKEIRLIDCYNVNDAVLATISQYCSSNVTDLSIEACGEMNGAFSVEGFKNLIASCNRLEFLKFYDNDYFSTSDLIDIFVNTSHTIKHFEFTGIDHLTQDVIENMRLHHAEIETILVAECNAEYDEKQLIDTSLLVDKKTTKKKKSITLDLDSNTTFVFQPYVDYYRTKL